VQIFVAFQFLTTVLLCSGAVCTIRCPLNMDRIGPGVRRCLGYVDPTTRLRWTGGVANTYCVARCPAVPVQPQTFVYPSDCTHL